MSRLRARWLLVPVLATGMGLVGTLAPRADETEDHLARLARVAEHTSERLGKARRLLSSGGQQFLLLHQREEELRRASSLDSTGANPGVSGLQAPAMYANDVFAPSDFISRFLGMTQSETSNAWCGQNAIIGFNDSGSLAATIFGDVSPSGSLSFTGWSQSDDGGQTFEDKGPLLADPLPPPFTKIDLFGDPVAGCTSERNFYLSTFADAFAGRRVLSGIAVSRSTDGGETFPSTVLAVTKNAFSHFLDKEWMATEPGPTLAQDDDEIHIAYTDFDSSGSSATCGREFRTAIEYVRSTDGGDTWTAPQVIDEVCGNDVSVQMAQVEAREDQVWVAWERFPIPTGIRRIMIRSSTDGGARFGPATKVTDVTPIGAGFLIQGAFRAHIDLQGLAVDRSGGPRDGRLYLTFHDGTRVQQEDPGAVIAGGGCLPTPELQYCFGDAYATTSRDGGASWSAPVLIHPADGETDQFFPHVEVDAAGRAWAVFHDRSPDPRNFLIDASLFASDDGGATWVAQPLDAPLSPPILGAQDFLVVPRYIGDYIAVTTDRLQTLPGALTSWGDQSLGDQNVAYDPP
jgi:hypothetical protein